MQIDCIGCVNQMHDHLEDQAYKASNDNRKCVLTDTFKIYADKTISLKDKFIENPENVAKQQHFLEIQKKDYEKINDKIGFIKKPGNTNCKTKYQHRCILHSNREISSSKSIFSKKCVLKLNLVWKDEIINIVSNELEDIESLGDIDESYFLMRLKVTYYIKYKICIS